MNNYQFSILNSQLSSAYLLVVHGSRNLNYGKQLDQLVQNIQSHLDSQGISVVLATAYLELTFKPLHQEIIRFAQDCATQGYQSVKILPLFLLSGTHVTHDIPHQLALAEVESPLTLELIPHLGTSDNLISCLRKQFHQVNTNNRLLIAHGTSLTEGNQELEKIAYQLEAQVAYWSMQPYFVDVVKDLITSGVERLSILPYFLFTGKITETIVSEINNLQQKSSIQIITLPTLAQTHEFIEIIINWMEIIKS